ncbi:mitochondrial substrate carrier [Chloropicon primus]|uniref:Mitochondrial substrate carrier n=1 Tax=Chloropicon primus TaxID=1764295 RepID=A0A5B8MBY3_9CHLO|nr:mitochondrial substrate carrier [Chloropicon primus]UPQ97183.1 mitochondrial substrate carrier [Chloropicon primus]|eukprot:QDZ17968.1 mitochondrial substrate carrier [Chloropicon primus]
MGEGGRQGGGKVEEKEEAHFDGGHFTHAEALRPYKLLLSGAVAGVVSRTSTAPIDRLRMLFQVHESRSRMTIMQGVRKMAAEGTIKSFFRGNGANCLKIAPETALKFAINDRIKRFVCNGGDTSKMGYFERLLSGGISGGIAQGSIYPLEMIRTRLGVAPVGTYVGITDCARQVYTKEGVRALYRGLAPSMSGIIPYAGTDIATFEIVKQKMVEYYGGEPPGYVLIGTGMFASSVAQLVSYPFALVRTRLQAQGMGGETNKYNGMIDVVVKTVRREGMTGLYKGIVPNLLKLAPAAGISWYTFEKTKIALGIDIRS